MTPATTIALQIALKEKIRRREELNEMAQQYRLRADIIVNDEITALSDEIRQLQADLE